MCGRVPTSKCWLWTGRTSRTCSTLQIPPPEISCKSSSNGEPCCRRKHSGDPQVQLELVACRLSVKSRHLLKLGYWKGSGMSALGQKQTCAVQKGMSALTPKADMCGAPSDVR